MDIIKLKVAEEMEEYIRRIEDVILEVELRVKTCETPEKTELKKTLDELRLKHSHALTTIVIYKAKHGIFTNLKRLK